MSEKAQKKPGGRLWLLGFLIILFCLCGAVGGVIPSLALDSRNGEPVGTIVASDNVVYRRSSSRAIWDRLTVGSNVYVGDTIRTADLSSTTLYIDRNSIDLNESYNLLDYDDDSGNGTNARLTISAVSGNSYLYRVRAYSNSASGPYRIWASHRGNAPIMAPNTVITELRFGTQISGNLVGGDEYWYSVRATENGYITVGTIGSTDTYLEAYNSSYVPLGTDDDSGGNGQALLQIQVQAGQTYLFKLRGYNSSNAGPYIIWANFSRAAG
jgi:hypothetical protein